MPDLHRPSPRARGDQPPGIRGPAPVRPRSQAAGYHAGGGRPQRADQRPLQGHRRRGKPHPGRDPGEELRGLRRALLRHGGYSPGHRPHHRPGTGLHPAGHDHRLRRFPHLDPWRLRGARLRHRHLRGGARAGDPDADPEPGQEHAHQRGRRAAARHHRQRPDPRHHRQDRHGGRDRPCDRVCRRGHSRALHGRPHDGLQHVDRGRRAGRLDRARRDHLRLS